MVLLMVGVFRGDKSFGLVSVLSVIALAAAAGAIVGQGDATTPAFDGAFVADGFARFTKLLILLGAAPPSRCRKVSCATKRSRVSNSRS